MNAQQLKGDFINQSKLYWLRQKFKEKNND